MILPRDEQLVIAVVLQVIGAGIIAPEPAPHFRHHGTALLVRVRANALAVVHVVAFLRKRGDHLDVLRVPVPFRIVRRFAASGAAQIVQPVLQKNAQGFVFALPDEVRISVAAGRIGAKLR